MCLVLFFSADQPVIFAILYKPFVEATIWIERKNEHFGNIDYTMIALREWSGLERFYRAPSPIRVRFSSPAFSLGRTQELIYEIDRLRSEPKLKKQFPPLAAHDLPVFIDSPLALKITEKYNDLNQYWDAEAKQLVSQGDQPLDFAG